MQLNASADNTTMKKKAQKSTHQNLVVIPVDVENSPSDEDFLQTVNWKSEVI
jgi:hypothetical protein